MGLSENSLTQITKPFSCLNHCKVSCDSPCCTKICIIVLLIPIHTNVISDSDEDEDTDKQISK